METSIINNNLKFVEELLHTFKDKESYREKLANIENYEKNKLLNRDQICLELVADDNYMKGDTIV